MKIESLKVFCDLAETQSFTKAARINEVTQSAVSQQISALEHTFKAVLVERGKRKFRLTPEGELLYEHSKQVLDIYNGLGVKLKETSELISGTIRIATIYSIGLHELPPYLQKFLKAYPSANLHVEYRHAQQVYEDVLANAVDLGLVAYPARGRNIQIVPLRTDPQVVICHPQHPLAKRKTTRIKNLAGFKFIGFERQNPTRKALDRLFRENHIAPDHAMEFDNVETVKRAVEIDFGIAIVPEATVTQEVADHTLAVVRIEDRDTSRPLAAIHTRAKALTPAMKQFIALLKEPL